MYLLATHPDVQQKLHKEIDAVFPNKVSGWYLENKGERKALSRMPPHHFLGEFLQRM